MAAENLDTIDFTRLSDRNAVEFIGKYDDGRESRYAIDVFAVDDDFAYGEVMAMDQTEIGSDSYTIDTDLSRYYARLPRVGVVIAGEVTVEVAQDERAGWPRAGYAEAEYGEHTVVADSFRLHTRQASE